MDFENVWNWLNWDALLESVKLQVVLEFDSSIGKLSESFKLVALNLDIENCMSSIIAFAHSNFKVKAKII